MGTASTFGSGARRADIRVYFDAEGMRALFEALNVGDDLQNLAFHVIEAEWRAFDSVTGLFGRAACQDDARSFLRRMFALCGSGGSGRCPTVFIAVPLRP